ncbi:hypothetical protein CDV55_108647 [Aspergillus turcosus]|nr:hypothetical protein CDV55_108647 [Aspergillus turcosus]
MSFDLPSVSELKRAAEVGQRITPEDVSVIAQAESELTGKGPVKGGPAATAQSLAMRQMNFDTKLDEVSRKPQSHITQEDAREIQATEGRAFNKPPGAGSVAAQVRSIANRNEALGLPPVNAGVAVYVTKDDAREAQRAESIAYGGQNPAGGMAAQMQSAADKIDFAPADEYHAIWYELTDRISYLPGGILRGNVSYKGCFHDLPRGLQTHVYAPTGLDIRDKWTVCGNMPGEPREAIELGLPEAPREGLYLREDVQMRCQIWATSFVKKTLKKAHATLVDRLIIKADLLKERAEMNSISLSSPTSDSSHRFSVMSAELPVPEYGQTVHSPREKGHYRAASMGNPFPSANEVPGSLRPAQPSSLITPEIQINGVSESSISTQRTEVSQNQERDSRRSSYHGKTLYELE